MKAAANPAGAVGSDTQSIYLLGRCEEFLGVGRLLPHLDELLADRAVISAIEAAVVPVAGWKTKKPRQRAHLRNHGVRARPGTQAVHMLRYYKTRFGQRADDLPGARDCGRHLMAIPLHNRMTDQDYRRVVQAIIGVQ